MTQHRIRQLMKDWMTAQCIAYLAANGHRCCQPAIVFTNAHATYDVLCITHATSSWLQFLCFVRQTTSDQALQPWSINADALLPATQRYASGQKPGEEGEWLL